MNPIDYFKIKKQANERITNIDFIYLGNKLSLVLRLLKSIISIFTFYYTKKNV